jgi:tight adherence protein B
VLLWTDGTRLVLGLVLLAGALGVERIVTRTRSRNEADRRRSQVVEVCEALAGELAAGQPMLNSLERCAETWPQIEVVVAAARLDADVPTALSRLAAAPGAEDLRAVAAAWQVAEGSGAGLAAALGQVAASAREVHAGRELVRGELASALATARMVALLPLLSLAMASGVGADPFHFLLATPWGLACLAAGLALAYAGMSWLDLIADRVQDR